MGPRPAAPHPKPAHHGFDAASGRQWAAQAALPAGSHWLRGHSPGAIPPLPGLQPAGPPPVARTGSAAASYAPRGAQEGTPDCAAPGRRAGAGVALETHAPARFAPLRPRADATASRLARVEEAISERTARGSAQAQAQAQEIQEVAEALSQVRSEEHESILRWNGELAAARSAGRELRRQLEASRVEGREAEGERCAAVAGLAAPRGELLREEAALRARCVVEAAEEVELQDRLASAEWQLQRRARVWTASPVLGGGGGASGGADVPQARARAVRLRGEVTALQRALAGAEARVADLRELLPAGPAQPLPERSQPEGRTQERARDRAQIVQQALSDLKQLHAAMGRRFAEFEGLRDLLDGAHGAGVEGTSEELEAMQEQISLREAAADRLGSEIREVAQQESEAQAAELRLLAVAQGGDAALRSLRTELEASECRGADLAALLGHNTRRNAGV
uniref:Uncharacterized protein n=1 Tax=Alexandrium monilatum TaxID=311494 RepID=A0A7S4R3C8_9DINO|mmetsp:Transcript_21013/g.65843  ORF Transcript_21013/g.65843 Transcript_21013/m.65843 type:complete len:454 (-) Transcript_21013:118-1479(-)